MNLQNMNASELKGLYREVKGQMFDAQDAGDEQGATEKAAEAERIYKVLREKQDQEFWARQQRDTSNGF